MTLPDNMRGALLMMGSMAGFTINDTFVKAAGAEMPLSQILTLRGVFSCVALFVMARAFGALDLRLSRKDWGAVLLRSVAEVAAAYFFLTALIHMPLANVTALLQSLPLTVTLASAVFLREPVGWRRWAAIGVGFLGMLLIVQPGTDGFSTWSVYALIAVLCVTLRDLIVRRLSPSVPSLTVTLFTALAVMLFGIVWSFGQDWVALTPRRAGLILGTGVFVTAAYLCSVMAMRVGEIGFVAPFRYTGLVWALILGWLVFGDWPGALTLAGAAIIVATGLFTLWRETVTARRGRRGQAGPA